MPGQTPEISDAMEGAHVGVVIAVRVLPRAGVCFSKRAVTLFHSAEESARPHGFVRALTGEAL